MKVRCIDNSGSAFGRLEVGRAYEVVGFSRRKFYVLAGFTGLHFRASRFEPVIDTIPPPESAKVDQYEFQDGGTTPSFVPDESEALVAASEPSARGVVHGLLAALLVWVLVVGIYKIVTILV